MKRPAAPPAPALLLALVLGAAIPIACSSPAASTSSPAVRTPQPTAVIATDTPTPPEETPELPGQSESEFGLIWDDIPDSFPVPADAAIADPLHGPVSGAWTVPVATASAPTLAGFYRDALDEIGWGTGIDGPLEDGSYTVWSSDGYGCETFTTILPRGDESLVTVLFGAGCPFR